VRTRTVRIDLGERGKLDRTLGWRDGRGERQSEEEEGG
jgi:hypothetical protein